ncbi:hypothetical protein [Sinorhizobium fredii]|uniref:Lipoprotein n=1 Tax=Rhizobium fredii TaxID=380 RepID=A0A844AJR6_RHIFR|nr:hypothetical protein [Sinorhizobium fredii]AWI57259.1 hypothetical protein AB395_00001603 [Sinorhizobium fredii CCBAU 45436]AWM25056.1 hypothetical protein AOX55_00001802 [Sinorhizobium fredii CCBAU 25509]MQW96419.1 hypothetical protein [Sinorhizobium fredii]MQX12332.1 hypothetical protein [Sinorhizobium fredii]GEC31105.1 hypothetical protein EFR01_12760 [Sinorhizobium fredii]
MRAVLLLLLLIVFSTLAGCSQTGRTSVSSNPYTPGSGDYYTGIVPPTQF